MSATECVCELLDERGVEYRTYGTTDRTWFEVGNISWFVIERENGNLTADAVFLTPEQVISVTLGDVPRLPHFWTHDGTCHNASKVMDEHGQARFACSECGAWIDSRMLWNPEYRNGESPWVRDCKLNYCPNCGRRIEVTNG